MAARRHAATRPARSPPQRSKCMTTGAHLLHIDPIVITRQSTTANTAQVL